MKPSEFSIIELKVNNHPGVMSHITGLFSRRGYNLEGILCGSISEGSNSIMFLLVSMNEQYNQVLLQLEKLHDVLEIRERPEYSPSAFFKIEKILLKK